MGEAKRRKIADKYYGMKPKHGRGIFLSAPITVDGEKIVAASSSIDPLELRRAVLFWDRLVWPDSKIISFGSNDDEKLLEAEGILTRPRPLSFNEQAGVGGISALYRIENSSDITIGASRRDILQISTSRNTWILNVKNLANGLCRKVNTLSS